VIEYVGSSRGNEVILMFDAKKRRYDCFHECTVELPMTISVEGKKVSYILGSK